MSPAPTLATWEPILLPALPSAFLAVANLAQRLSIKQDKAKFSVFYELLYDSFFFFKSKQKRVGSQKERQFL